MSKMDISSLALVLPAERKTEGPGRVLFFLIT